MLGIVKVDNWTPKPSPETNNQTGSLTLTYQLKLILRMFIGEYQHSIDEKGRVSLPAKFRARLASGCVVTRGIDKCLWIYPQDEWEKLAEKISQLPITQKDSRNFSRLILAGAMDLSIDKLGRINLPNYLKDYAGIKKKIICIGMYNRIEIWPEETWIEFKKNMEENSETIAENLSQLGF